MQVNKTLETQEGTIKFEGELSQQESDLVIKLGLNYLLSIGALPHVQVHTEEKDVDAVDFQEGPDTVQ